MKHSDYTATLRQDAEFVAAERRLKPIFDLAERIYRLRLERGWSQTELARRAGTRQANISQIERGSGNPTFSMLCSISDALGVPLGDLIGDRASPQQDRNEEERTLSAEQAQANMLR